MKTKALIEGFNRLITRETPDLFVTVTFAKQTSSLLAKKKFKWFFKYLNTKDKRFFQKTIKTWILLEKEGFRRGVHIHAFIRGIDPKLAEALERKCDRFFGKSRVVPYDPEKNASYYLSRKYSSNALEDYDYCKINSRIREKRKNY